MAIKMNSTSTLRYCDGFFISWLGFELVFGNFSLFTSVLNEIILMQFVSRSLSIRYSNVSTTTDELLKHTKGKHRKSRSKRGVTQLYSMVKCATGCDPIIYKGYGCYCGFLGTGKPLDGIDKCCKMHDACYLKSSCPTFLEYFVPYLWKCYKGTPLCGEFRIRYRNGK